MSTKEQRLIIAIKFGDNDFWSTFHTVLRHIYQLWTHNGSCNFGIEHIVEDKGNLASFINRLVALHSEFEIHGPANELLLKYLDVRPENLYLGEEAVKFLNDPDNAANWNYDVFVLDTAVYDPNYKIYSK